MIVVNQHIFPNGSNFQREFHQNGLSEGYSNKDFNYDLLGFLIYASILQITLNSNDSLIIFYSF